MMAKLINLLLSVAAFVRETGLKISYSPKGLRIFIPWTETMKCPPAEIEAAFKDAGITVTEASVAEFLGRIVQLDPGELEREKKRILSLAELIPLDEQGEIPLVPWLHYRQCWEIILHLRSQGFAVRPGGVIDETGSVKFRPKDGKITLWIRCKDREAIVPESASDPALEKEGVSFDPPAEWLTADKVEVVEIKPRPATQKKHLSRPVSKKISKMRKNRQNSNRVSKLLGRIRIERVPFSELEAPGDVPRRFMPAKAAPHRKKS